MAWNPWTPGQQTPTHAWWCILWDTRTPTSCRLVAQSRSGSLSTMTVSIITLAVGFLRPFTAPVRLVLHQRPTFLPRLIKATVIANPPPYMMYHAATGCSSRPTCGCHAGVCVGDLEGLKGFLVCFLYNSVQISLPGWSAERWLGKQLEVSCLLSSFRQPREMLRGLGRLPLPAQARQGAARCIS